MEYVPRVIVVKLFSSRGWGCNERELFLSRSSSGFLGVPSFLLIFLLRFLLGSLSPLLSFFLSLGVPLTSCRDCSVSCSFFLSPGGEECLCRVFRSSSGGEVTLWVDQRVAQMVQLHGGAFDLHSLRLDVVSAKHQMLREGNSNDFLVQFEFLFIVQFL